MLTPMPKARSRIAHVVHNTLLKISKFNLIILDFSLVVCQFLNVLEHLELLSILIYLGNGSPEGANFQGIPRHFPSKNVLLNILEPLILLETHFQVFQGEKRQIKLFSRKMMFS